MTPPTVPTSVLRDDAAVALVRALTSALEARDRGEIVRIITALISGRARLGRRWAGMAQVMIQSGELDRATQALELLLANAVGDVAVTFQAAAMFAAMGRPARAAMLVERIDQRAIDPAQRHHFLGTAASELGHADVAAEHFRKALSAKAASGQIWHALAVVHRFIPGDPALLRLEGIAEATASGSGEDVGLLHYALGKARDDVGAHDDAFAAFARGAAVMDAARPYDIAADVAHADATIGAWTANAFDGLLRGPKNSDPPIFVFGLPRSGTTLVEQILASHSAVAGGGENDALGTTIESWGEAMPDDLARRGSDGLAQAANLHRHLLAQRFGQPGRVVDKGLGNARFVGLLALMFPDAPMLLVRRDALDTAWSIFRTYFARGQDWSWSLTDIAAHMRAEERLFAHWQAVLGDRLFIIDYATLVGDPATQIPRMLAHCGLPFEVGVLEPHMTERAVTTASVTQVRHPINIRAIGAAGPYRRHLQPFIDAYGYTG